MNLKCFITITVYLYGSSVLTEATSLIMVTALLELFSTGWPHITHAIYILIYTDDNINFCHFPSRGLLIITLRFFVYLYVDTRNLECFEN